jgi:hypothetical protein
MNTVTVWIIMATSTWSYEGVIHEGSWPNTKPAILYLSQSECERSKPARDVMPMDVMPMEDEIQAETVTFFECAAMHFDANQLKPLAK